MRICLLSERYPPDMGGLAQTVARHARALSNAGHVVHVCVPTAGLLPDSFRTQTDDGITVHRLGLHRQWRDTLSSWSDRLIELNQETDYDLFHGYMVTYAGLVATYLARFCGKKSVVSAHDSDLDHLTFDAARAPFVYKTLEWADVVTADSEDIALKIRTISDRRDVQIIRNSVDVDLFSPDATDTSLRDRLGLDDSVVLGFMGEATAEKGLSVLLRAFARVATHVPAHLVFVGGIRAEDQPAMDLFERTYPHLSIRKVPYQAHTTMPVYYNLMDMVLILSQRDGLPNTLLEAMACARTVVATWVRGIAEVVTHGENGWLIPPGDEDALVKGISALIEDAEARRKIGTAARAKIVSEYASSIELDANLAIYERLLGD